MKNYKPSFIRIKIIQNGCFWRVHLHFNFSDENTKQITAENDKEARVEKVTGNK